jgi:hypothetical protein
MPAVAALLATIVLATAPAQAPAAASPTDLHFVRNVEPAET